MRRLQIVDEEYCFVQLQGSETQKLFNRTFVKKARGIALGATHY